MPPLELASRSAAQELTGGGTVAGAVPLDRRQAWLADPRSNPRSPPGDRP